ncbi:MAG: four helix bundle protein [Salinivirgaceae bacterium]
MDNKTFGKTLEERTLKFAVAVIHLSASLPESPEGKVIRNQLSKSGTSIGANYREANRSQSKADFIHKIHISESEASETLYWLEIIKTMNWCSASVLQPLIDECSELLALLTSIRSKLKNK